MRIYKGLIPPQLLAAIIVAVAAGRGAQAARLVPATPEDLETRYCCGGGGTYATETGIQWYREWDGCYVKYPSRVNMPQKMWTAGKMDNRPATMKGGPSNITLNLPYPGSYSPNETVINNVFTAEAPFIQQTLQYSPAHLGNIWSIANEPNWGPKFAPADYAREFHLYAEFIKGIDPTARIATGGVLVSNAYVGPSYTGIKWYDWLDQFRAAYQDLYGTPPPVDLWDIHPYDLGDYSGGTTPARKAINNVVAMRQYLDAAGLTNAPIQISEISILGISDDTVQTAFIDEFFGWLNTYAAAYKVERWFWWGSTTLAFGETGLFDGSYNRNYINVKGDAYMYRMGRVFVDPNFTPDTTRMKGSMRNPYPSLSAVLAAYHAGQTDMRVGNIVYDFSTRSSYVLTATSRADFDNDGDIDQEDFGHLQACMTMNAAEITPDCASADFNGDGRIDTTDIAQFTPCMTAPGGLADPACPK